MIIKLKSLRQFRESYDGLRILITRFRPRYAKKGNGYWDAYYRGLPPSGQLWYDYLKSNKIGRTRFRERFIEQMKNNPKSIELIQWLDKFENDNNESNNSNNVTLMYFCQKEKSCHRSIVK